MRIASVRVISETPERDGWARLRRWAEPRGLLRDIRKHPVFGFNNPAPRPGEKTYGYEWWIRVPAQTVTEGEVELKDFEGGLFLVTTCQLLGDPLGAVGDVWLKLWQLTRSGPYRWRGTQELERPNNPLADESAMRLDLCLPVRALTDAPAQDPTRRTLTHSAR